MHSPILELVSDLQAVLAAISEENVQAEIYDFDSVHYLMTNSIIQLQKLAVEYEALKIESKIFYKLSDNLIDKINELSKKLETAERRNEHEHIFEYDLGGEG